MSPTKKNNLLRTLFGILPFTIPFAACVTKPVDSMIVPQVDLNKFMGDWYVQGHTPIFFDKESTDQRESYQLDAKGGIETHYVFKKNDSWHHYRPYAVVENKVSNSHWKMQFLWPFTSDYLIVRLAPDYATTVISVPDKDKIWIMSRARTIAQPLYQSIVADLVKDGYDVSKMRRVPQGTEAIARE